MNRGTITIAVALIVAICGCETRNGQERESLNQGAVACENILLKMPPTGDVNRALVLDWRNEILAAQNASTSSLTSQPLFALEMQLDKIASLLEIAADDSSRNAVESARREIDDFRSKIRDTGNALRARASALN